MIILFITLFMAAPVWGQALHAPKICSQGQLTLKNLTSQSQNIWFQYYGEKGFEEVHWVLEKFEVKTLTSEDLPAFEYSIKTVDPGIIAFTRCSSELTPWTTRVPGTGSQVCVLACAIGHRRPARRRP